MSARATNALERQGAVTVADLLAIPRFELIRLRGVGMATRTELVDLQRQLRERLGTQEPRVAATSRSTTEAEPDVQRLDAFVAQMLPKRTSRNASEIDSLRLLLGLEATFTPAGDWASQTEVAQQREVTRARVGQIAAKARERWRRLPAMTRLRDELVAHITQLGGVAGTRELELLVTAERGSGDSVADGVFATAVVRAAVETEGAMGDQRWTVRRTGRRVVIGVAGATPEQRQLPSTMPCAWGLRLTTSPARRRCRARLRWPRGSGRFASGALVADAGAARTARRRSVRPTRPCRHGWSCTPGRCPQAARSLSGGPLCSEPPS